jgi:hypothetical protein
MPSSDAADMTCIDQLISAIASGDGIPAHLYADDAVLDATVPNWRWTTKGSDAISATYATWFADPAEFAELHRQPVAGGEVIRYLLTWEEQGVPHAAHHCHLLLTDAAGRIASETVFCGGRWDAELLAEMAGADR